MRWLKRPPANISFSIKAGLGASIAISSLIFLGYLSKEILLMAPFGASCVLLFAVPQSPLSQPANLIGGHLLASSISLFFVQIMPDNIYSLPLSVFFTVSLMVYFKITHPPAGANPIVIVLGQHSWFFLFFPVLFGSLLLFILAVCYHKLVTKIPYPIKS